MKKSAPATILGLLFISLLASPHGQTQATAGAQAPATAKPGMSFKENEEIPGELRQKTFLFVWEKIRDEYYDSTFGGVDWNRLKDRYAPRVAETKTSGEFHAMLGKMLAELGRSHLAIFAPHQMSRELKAAPEVRMTLEGVVLRIVEKRIAVYSVKPESPAGQAGLKAGDFLLKAGVAPMPSEEDIQKSPARAITAARRALSGEASTTAVLSILDGSGREKTMDVPRTVPFQDRANLGRSVFESRRLQPRIGYIWFDGWAFDLKPKLEAAFKDFMDTDGFVIDLRQNRGGVNPGVDYLASVLNTEPGLLGVETARNGERREWKHAGGGAGAYRGRLAILIDEASGSASEVFAAAMQESGRALVLGRTSYGGVLNSTQETIPTGGLLQFPHSDLTTDKGTRIEGRGVIPDIPVEISRADLIRGKDTVIERAVAAIAGGAPKRD